MTTFFKRTKISVSTYQSRSSVNRIIIRCSSNRSRKSDQIKGEAATGKGGGKVIVIIAEKIL